MTKIKLETIEFDILKDEVWIDQDDVAWYARHVDDDGYVWLERVVAAKILARDLVRSFRKLNDEPAAKATNTSREPA